MLQTLWVSRVFNAADGTLPRSHAGSVCTNLEGNTPETNFFSCDSTRSTEHLTYLCNFSRALYSCEIVCHFVFELELTIRHCDDVFFQVVHYSGTGYRCVSEIEVRDTSANRLGWVQVFSRPETDWGTNQQKLVLCRFSRSVKTRQVRITFSPANLSVSLCCIELHGTENSPRGPPPDPVDVMSLSRFGSSKERNEFVLENLEWLADGILEVIAPLRLENATGECEGEGESESESESEIGKAEEEGENGETKTLTTTFPVLTSLLIVVSSNWFSLASNECRTVSVELSEPLVHPLEITSEFLVAFLMGILPYSDLFSQENAGKLLDLFAVLRALEMKDHALYICHLVETCLAAETVFEYKFMLLKRCFERFEVRPSSFAKVRFACPLTQALFGCLQRNKVRMMSESCESKQHWLAENFLMMEFFGKSPLPVRLHEDFQQEECDIRTPTELLFEQRLVWYQFTERNDAMLFTNVELMPTLRSRGDEDEESEEGGKDGSDSESVQAHVEILFRTFDCFRMMLSFCGLERESFRRTRAISMENLTPRALRGLVQFAYRGEITFVKIGDSSETGGQIDSCSMPDLFLLLHFAELYAFDPLRDYVVALLRSFNAAHPKFLENLREVGTFVGLCSDEIVREILLGWSRQAGYDLQELEIALCGMGSSLMESRGPEDATEITNELYETMGDES